MHMISIPPMICFFVPVDFHVDRVTQDNMGTTYIMSLIYSKLAYCTCLQNGKKNSVLYHG